MENNDNLALFILIVLLFTIVGICEIYNYSPIKTKELNFHKQLYLTKE